MANLLRINDIRDPAERWKLTAREMLFRLVCRHRQGSEPNVLLHCTRRGGSTWLLNTLAAHPGMRYVGRPFMAYLFSRWRKEMPDLAEAAAYNGHYDFEILVRFEGEAERRFREVARRIVLAERHIYPAIQFWASYFHRRTDRVVFQVTNATSLIEYFDEHFPVATVILLRHPIANALSIMQQGWRPECADFLNHRWFVETQLTPSQVGHIRRIAAEGSLLQQHVLDWALKMLLPIRAFESGRYPSWLAVTYEQLVLQPIETLRIIAEHLNLPDLDAMSEQILRPSRTVTQTTAARLGDPDYLVRRWRQKVGDSDEEELMAILSSFGIHVYETGRDIAIDRYLLGSGDRLE